MIAALIAAAVVAQPAPASWILHRDEDALRSRIVELSAQLLGTPYVHSPLGEGQGFDPDPTVRFDAVDCLTYVEETLALALSRNPAEVPSVLQRLRYAHAPSYADRNHLMEAEWLPNNVRKGFLRDVTRRYGGEDTVRVEKVITLDTWRSPSSRALALPKDRQPVGSFPLQMIPLDKVAAHAREIPSGTLMLVVRQDLPGKVTRVTHLGFVVQKPRHTYLRHAARNHYERVIDEDLDTFLTRNSKYEKWKVTGVSLYQAQVPGGTVAASGRRP